jgi:3-oxoacyl-[acyl-carrier protein] reductase
MNSLSERVALVTGSSRGIGAAIAKRFADEGAAVAIHGRDRRAMALVSKEIERAGGRSVEVVAELTSFDAIEAARAEIESALGPVDILVANGGGSFTPPGPLEDIDEQGWRRSVDGNLTATFLTIKSFLPGMKARERGSIITISSSAARRPNPRSPIPYAAAKAGIEMMTQHLAGQVGPQNIRVNCIAPETILTERNEEHIPQDQIPGLIDAHPLKRLGTPDDVARAATFLASDESSWITGVVLDISGGAVMVR